MEKNSKKESVCDFLEEIRAENPEKSIIIKQEKLNTSSCLSTSLLT